MAQPGSITSWRKMERKRKPAWIGGVFMDGAVPVTDAFNVRAKASCDNCGALFELNLVKASVDPTPTPDSEPAHVEFSFPVTCPGCDLVFAGIRFEDEDATS